MRTPHRPHKKSVKSLKIRIYGFLNSNISPKFYRKYYGSTPKLVDLVKVTFYDL